MANVQHRAPRASLSAWKVCATLLLSLGLLLTAGACGFNAQTLQPYTPSDGVNLDVGEGEDLVKVRNLLLISHEPGKAILSGSLVSGGQDALVGLSGTGLAEGNKDGAALEASVPNPVALGNNTMVVLTDRAPITVTGPDLKPGHEAKLVLQFSKAGDVKVTVPILDATDSAYKTVSPAPPASPAADA